jgi:hypothetical protein
MRWLYFPSASTPFTPTDLANITAWWAADLSTKTGSPGSISQMNALTGSIHLAQATAARQPTDNTRTINGRVALDFAGDDEMNVSNSLGVSTSFHLFIVVKFDALADNDVIVNAGPHFNLNTDDGWALVFAASGQGAAGRLRLRVGNGSAVDTLTASTSLLVGTSVPHLIEAWSIGTTEMGIAIDGVAETEVPATGCSGPDAFVLLSRGSNLNCVDGAFCEAFLCTSQVTGGDLTDARTYLKNRWGTP